MKNLGERGNWQFLTVPRVIKVDSQKVLYVNEYSFKQIVDYYIGSPIPPQVKYIEVEKDEARHDWYHILIDEKYITITTSSIQAFHIALTTVKVLLSFSARRYIDCGEIEDWADREKRGVMLDVSRDRIYSLITITNLIDLFGILKFNQLILYIEHTYSYVGHEEVHQKASPYT